MTAEYLIYSKQNCPYCVRAKMLLSQLGKTYEEVVVTDGDHKEQLMARMEEAGLPPPKTVPQIFNGSVYIGGYTELVAALGDKTPSE